MKMPMRQRVLLGCLGLLAGAGYATAVQAEEPLAHKAGEAVRKAGEKTGEAVKKAGEKTGEALEKAGKKTGEALEKADAHVKSAAHKTAVVTRKKVEAVKEAVTK